MVKTKFSRRKFVETSALGAGCLALSSASRLFAAESPGLAPVIKNVWKQAKEYTMEFATAMPDDKYTFKPTDEVFSFAEQLLHLVEVNYWVFPRLKGEKSPVAMEALKSEGKAKADVIKILEDSFSYADGVIDGLDEAKVVEEVAMGKNKMVMWKILLFIVDHITHHRGQMVVYLRLNGMKPPLYRSGFYG